MNERARRGVTIIGLAIAVLLAAGAAFLLLLPEDHFYIFRRSNGGWVTISRRGIRVDPAPIRYTSEAFEQVEAYVVRLMASDRRKRYLDFFTPAGDRGFGLWVTDGPIEAHFTVEWRQEPEREKAIRGVFASLSIDPSEDYLAGNGGVPDATRLLAYPLSGDAKDVAALAKRILQELCYVSPTEPLDIGYREQ
jgi:hypothetical protein